MKTILRNKNTGLYFQGVSDWTAGPAEAFDFKYPERVIRFVLGAGLKLNEMELVFAFEDARYNIPLPLDERFGVSGMIREDSASPGAPWPSSPAPAPWAAALTDALCSAPKDTLDPRMFPRALGESL